MLGGTFNLPHAETHTLILPHAETHTLILPHTTAYNARGADDAMARIARALGSKTAAAGLFDVAVKFQAPAALKDLGIPESGLDKAADIAVANPYPSPIPLERNAIRKLPD